jgi:hypothetical protein
MIVHSIKVTLRFAIALGEFGAGIGQPRAAIFLRPFQIRITGVHARESGVFQDTALSVRIRRFEHLSTMWITTSIMCGTALQAIRGGMGAMEGKNFSEHEGVSSLKNSALHEVHLLPVNIC